VQERGAWKTQTVVTSRSHFLPNLLLRNDFFLHKFISTSNPLREKKSLLFSATGTLVQLRLQVANIQSNTKFA
jgi:hypothetical protein